MASTQVQSLRYISLANCITVCMCVCVFECTKIHCDLCFQNTKCLLSGGALFLMYLKAFQTESPIESCLTKNKQHGWQMQFAYEWESAASSISAPPNMLRKGLLCNPALKNRSHLSVTHTWPKGSVCGLQFLVENQSLQDIVILRSQK